MPLANAFYRVQLSAQFKFADVKKSLPALKKLGISTLYLSPILTAQPGSQHGYDIINFGEINPVLGGMGGFLQLVDCIHQYQMFLCLDIVPNHMAATDNNDAWQQVKKHGQSANTAYLFDINWQLSDDNKLVYRRFFDIDSLVCLHAQDDRVFYHSHALILSLIKNNHIDGLRIDHIDGLREPKAYLIRLAQVIGKPFYIVVEKILSNNETLANDWPVAGTTGYDFLNKLNQLFIAPEGFDALAAFYRYKTGDMQSIEVHRQQCLTQIIEQMFQQEFVNLEQELQQLLGYHSPEIKKTLMRLCTHMPCYRTYLSQFDTVIDKRTIDEILKKNLAGENQVVTDIKAILRLDFPSNLLAETKQRWYQWVTDWQIFTGPLMAKGFEDTCGYRTNFLLSLNDVGSEPDYFLPVNAQEKFHTFNLLRQKYWPESLNATTTHDTKRSEDARARLNVLSEITNVWHQLLKQWFVDHYEKKTALVGGVAPDIVDEFLIYQTLISIWPLDNDVTHINARCHGFLTKAMRERKIHSCWAYPNHQYEAAVHRFIDQLLADKRFIVTFKYLEIQTAFYGMLNSLSQLVLKITSPGIPDFYQGSETWSLMLVDPDNRQPVTIDKLAVLQSDTPLDQLLLTWQDGRIKYNTMQRLLAIRQQYLAFFLNADYLPLVILGAQQAHLIGFMRSDKDKHIIVITAYQFTSLLTLNHPWSTNHLHSNNQLYLPTQHVRRWYSPLTQQFFTLNTSKLSLTIKDILAILPFNLLESC